jgi:hypothetical protein
MFGQGGDLGQVLRDLDARYRGGDFLERPTVFVSRLQVERIHLAWPAVHPQQDARPLARRGGGFGGQGLERSQGRRAD